jgi:hypothetical protein
MSDPGPYWDTYYDNYALYDTPPADVEPNFPSYNIKIRGIKAFSHPGRRRRYIYPN